MTEEAFIKLKKVVTEPFILALLNFTKPFIIECDAFGIKGWAILMQKGRPIACYSKGLKGRELTLSTYKKEFLAILLAIQKWCSYLLGKLSRSSLTSTT